MTLIYENKKGETKTLEEMVKLYPKEWKQALKEEIHFWMKIRPELTLFDLIIEATDNFDELIKDYHFKESLDTTPINYNTILGNFIK